MSAGRLRTEASAGGWTGLVLLLAGLSAGCWYAKDRPECDRDGDCATGQVCYVDDRCVPRDVARRLGARVGDECVVRGRGEQGCEEGFSCQMGRCDGPPEFAGATVAVSDGPDAIEVRWEPAADETPPEDIVYRVYVAASSAAQSFDAPSATVQGGSSARVGGLEQGTRYFAVARAEDAHGQQEHNAVEVTATPGCIDYDKQVQPLFDEHCTLCHSGEGAPHGLQLESRETVLAGARRDVVQPCSAERTLIYRKVRDSDPPVGSRMPLGGPYLDDEQIAILGDWAAQGAGGGCPAPSSLCVDSGPPGFAGLAEATIATASSARLCWSPGGDDRTLPGDLIYDVYEAHAPGEQDFEALPDASSDPGASCITLPGRTPEQRYCWVVRARDAQGNRDANVREHCLTFPPAECIEFDDVLQPLFDYECIHCHGGADPLRGMSLESYEGVWLGGQTGGEVVACKPDDSLIHLKTSLDDPPVGVRMPADGPPYLTTPQIDAIEQWIVEGGRRTCADPDPCSGAKPPGGGVP